MQPAALPSSSRMYRALVERDSEFEGVFVVGVRTTGIFCRPTCPARKPKPENVDFFPGAREALFAGFRPCKRCHPLEAAGETPDWLRPLLVSMEEEPERRWRDADLRKAGLEPARVRRWFHRHHGMTFHAYQRARRLGRALGRLKHGEDIVQTALEHGYDSLSGFSEALRQLTGTSPGQARDQRTLQATRVVTPLGPVLVATDEEALVLLEFLDRRAIETQLRTVCRRMKAVLVPGDNALTRQVGQELDAYFAGKLRKFEVPFRAPGTEFQEKVWAELCTIPYGKTRSYGEQARRIGRPTAVRAVARANGENRIAIVIPCHRVIGADGTLTGYGGGLWRKQKLLEIEGATGVQPRLDLD